MSIGEGNVTSKNAYIVLAVVFVASLAAVGFFHFFPVGAISNLAAIPAIGSLCYALFQLARDTIAHERSVQLEEAKNRFTVGATSHMADVVFDKHVEFCEEYAEGAHAAMELLFRRGPTEEILKSEGNLLRIRTRRAIWLPPELEEKLDKFQQNLRTIGAYAPPRKEGDAPSADLKRSYNAFAAAMGWPDWTGEKVDTDAAVQRAIYELSKILGVWELTRLRAKLIGMATVE